MTTAADLAALEAGVRSGDEVALKMWSDWLEENDQARQAWIARQLPRVRAVLLDELLEVHASVPAHRRTGRNYWTFSLYSTGRYNLEYIAFKDANHIEIYPMENGVKGMRVIGYLFDERMSLAPGIEWLLRRLGLRHGSIRTNGPDDIDDFPDGIERELVLGQSPLRFHAISKLYEMTLRSQRGEEIPTP